ACSASARTRRWAARTHAWCARGLTSSSGWGWALSSGTRRRGSGNRHAQHPAVGGANARLVRAGLDKLEWLVVADLFEHETAGFWKRPGVDPKQIQTEVFVLPACSGVEKEGSIVNSGRWA